MIYFRKDVEKIDEGSFNGAQYYKSISEIMGKIHSEIDENKFNLIKPAMVDFREEVFQGKNQKRVVIYLMSNGCEWALKNGNGCTVCGHLAKQTREKSMLTSKQHIEQFLNALESIDFKKYPLLNLYNNGLF